MPITKNALIRFQTLDRCFRNPGKRYYLTDLLEECNKSLQELDPNSKGIARRQLYDDINFMESSQGWSIPLERIKDGRKKYFRYEDQTFSINNQPINELEAEQLKSAMQIMQRFKGLPQFKWINELLPKIDQAFNFTEDTSNIISFDNNEFLKGLEFIDPIFNAILYKRSISIKYQSFKNPLPITKVISPYHLKEYNNRWYVYGRDMEYQSIINPALDRIISIEDSKEKFMDCEIDFEEYFEDSLGVSIVSDAIPIKIKLRVEKSQWPYIETKPIHGSQKVLERADNHIDICLELVPNYELESQILHFGEKVEVLGPMSLREKIKSRIQILSKKYN
jgi:predicted DNA-binding transcriptional regulator YafY